MLAWNCAWIFWNALILRLANVSRFLKCWFLSWEKHLEDKSLVSVSIHMCRVFASFTLLSYSSTACILSMNPNFFLHPTFPPLFHLSSFSATFPFAMGHFPRLSCSTAIPLMFHTSHRNSDFLDAFSLCYRKLKDVSHWLLDVQFEAEWNLEDTGTDTLSGWNLRNWEIGQFLLLLRQQWLGVLMGTGTEQVWQALQVVLEMALNCQGRSRVKYTFRPIFADNKLFVGDMKWGSYEQNVLQSNGKKKVFGAQAKQQSRQFELQLYLHS